MRTPKCHRLASHSSLKNRSVLVASRLPATTARRCSVRVVGDLSSRGRPILPKSITVERIMGEGSFGQVFGGYLSTSSGNQRVVLKRVKTRVQGAEEMSQMEHLLNVYASRVARGHCADFQGYCEVADSEATGRLTPGLWLVWKYEGSKTLSYYLRRRDTIRALATDLEVPELLVLPTVMRHIFEGLAAFHAAGLVHRDVKPLNMILAEDVRRFKLIDLGACADLRTGTNYVPEESILDLNFCPPEQFVMPTDSPHIAKQAGLIKMAISPMLWAKHKPDRFDTWSAGMVMLQLAIPATRTDRALRNFNAAYGPKYKYDLAAWRKGTHMSSRDCALLDADDGAGWELLQSLLAPRHIQVDDNGGVSFVNDTPFQRISAFEALKHRFIKVALETAAPAGASTSGSSSAAAASSSFSAAGPARNRGRWLGDVAAAAPTSGGSRSADASGSGVSAPRGVDPLGSALGMWRDMTGRLFDLEARIMRQTSATELQTTTVRRLKEQLDSGKVDPAQLQKEEKVLSKMQSRLAGLQQDFSATANQASGVFSFFGFGGKPQQQQQPSPAAEPRSQKDKSKSLQALRDASAASAAATGPSSPSAPPSPSPVSSAAGMFNSVWEQLSSRLGDLERKISNQASATERQSLVVKGLRVKVQAGEAEPEMLVKAERTLSRMERRLLDLDRDYWAAKQNAKGALAGNIPTENGSGGRRSSGSREQSAAGADAAARQSDSDPEASGSFWSRLLGSRSGSSMDGSTKEAAVQQAAQAQAASPPPPPQPPAQEPPLQRALSPLFRRPPPSPPPQQQNPVPSTAAAVSPPIGQQQKQPASPQSGYRSIFGFGGADTGKRTAQSSVDTPPAAVPAEAAPLPRATSPRSSSGGFLGGLFGRPRQQNERGQVPEVQPPQASAGGKGSVGRTAAAASATPPSTSSSGLPVPVPAAPTAASGGDALVDGASRVIRNSLSFTGLAAKIATDLATAFKADAERYLKELEIQEAAKRQQRTLDLALLALLREAQPPVRSTCTFEEAEERFAAEARWAALADGGRRRELFGKYLQTAKKVEEQAAAAADAAFRAALRRFNVTAASRWEDIRDALDEVDTAVAGVQDAARRQQLFLEVVAELQLQAALQAASLKAELQFTSMLTELRDPPVTSTSTWALVRKAVVADPRCMALPERRRRELFEALTARLFEEETARYEIAAAAAEVAELAEAAESLKPAIARAAAVTATPSPPSDHPTSKVADLQQRQQEQQLHLQTSAAPPHPAPNAAGSPPVRPSGGAMGDLGASVGPPVLPGPAASSSETLTSFPLEDDDLSAALAGMEAALESALKAVSSAPLPSSFNKVGNTGSSSTTGSSSITSSSIIGVLGAGTNNPVNFPPVQFGSTPVNGATRSTAPPSSLGGAGALPAAEGIRLEELRREQARLRAEYEVMAQRLREMEERLKGQAQLMSLAEVPSDEEEQLGQQQSPADAQAAAAISSSGGGRDRDGTVAPVRGQRWR
ncbi:hypothetical protein VaNZ11_012901 [Volvox africanus]|uniref:Protein kinase domain-containing protein n=1 Tax=Volvox africanus TaxID=51714 RepID=A0ABQ5SEX8_9CHLO|nr:hypothetical protein VaNZ11_012901 [Volvox africanus]